MNNKSLFRFILTILLIFTAAGLGSAKGVLGESAAPDIVYNPAADAPWFTSWADNTTSGGLGAFPSIAYSPINGLPYISYYDSANGNLMLANYVPDGSGNCGVNGSWECQVIDGDGLGDHSNHDVGKYSSLAFHVNTSGALGWRLGISYYDATDKVLRYAAFIVNQPFAGFWDYVTITPTVMFGGSGMYSSLQYNSGGDPKIAYYASAMTMMNWTGYLKIATKVSSGGNCGVGTDAGKWECTTIDSGDDEGVGKYASLDIDYDDQVNIAYYDADNGNLKYAIFYGIGGSCSNGWECNTIDGTSADVGAFASLKARQFASDTFHIAYYDKTHGKLKYATSGWSSGGNCGSGNSWYCMVVDTMGTGSGMSQTGISLDIDTVGTPIITYQDASVDLAPAKLNIARPAYIYEETGGVGNCGDNFPTFEYWWCDTIDTAGYGQGNVHVADYVSIAVNSSGFAAIAYFEQDDYNVETALKVAYQRPQVYLPVVMR